MHWTRWRRHGHPLAGRRFRGGGWSWNGYAFCHVDHRGVRVHRQIMEEALGRKLEKGEIVHHLNGLRADNRLDNLRIMTRAEHLRLHREKIEPR